METTAVVASCWKEILISHQPMPYHTWPTCEGQYIQYSLMKMYERKEIIPKLEKKWNVES